MLKPYLVTETIECSSWLCSTLRKAPKGWVWSRYQIEIITDCCCRAAEWGAAADLWSSQGLTVCSKASSLCRVKVVQQRVKFCDVLFHSCISHWQAGLWKYGDKQQVRINLSNLLEGVGCERGSQETSHRNVSILGQKRQLNHILALKYFLLI